jgi:hypothetical protein
VIRKARSGPTGISGNSVHVFENEDGQAEFEPHIPLLDRITDGLVQRMTIALAQAFKQRAIKGVPSPTRHRPEGQLRRPAPRRPDVGVAAARRRRDVGIRARRRCRVSSSPAATTNVSSPPCPAPRCTRSARTPRRAPLRVLRCSVSR